MKKTSLWLCLVAGITFITYAPSLRNGFVTWDDPIYLLENPLVHSLDLDHLRRIFTSAIGLTYIPLSVLSFNIEHHIVGFHPFLYHLDNVLLHTGVTALVFLLALRLGMTLAAATAAALIFGVHPMHVESVAWVTERKDVLYSLFYLLALLDYQRYLTTTDRRMFRRALGWGLLSILAKSMALSLPLVLLLLDWFHGRRDWKAIIRDKLLFCVFVVPVASLTYFLNTRIMSVATDPLTAVLIAIWTGTFYIKKFIFPFVLLPDYQLPLPVSLWHPAYIWSAVVLLLGVWALFRYRANRWVVFAFVYYLVSIFFLIRFSTMHPKGLVADRFMYLPGMGACFLVGVLWDRWRAWSTGKNVFHRRAVYLFLIILITALAGKTVAQSLIWKNGETFWNYVIGNVPPKALYYYGRGEVYLDRKEYARALADYNRALAIDPRSIEALSQRSAVYYALGRYDEAMADLNRDLAITGEAPDMYHNRGVLYKALGHYDLALADFNKALILEPRHDKSLNGRGAVNILLGRYDQALADLNQSLAIRPDRMEAYLNRGILYKIKGQYELALADFNRALAIRKDGVSFFNRGVVYSLQGRDDLAVADFDRVLELNTRNAEAYQERAAVFGHQGRIGRALADLTSAIILQPDNAEAYRLRAWVYRDLQRYNLAIQDLNKAIELQPGDGQSYHDRSLCYKDAGQDQKASDDAVKARSLGYPADGH